MANELPNGQSRDAKAVSPQAENLPVTVTVSGPSGKPVSAPASARAQDRDRDRAQARPAAAPAPERVLFTPPIDIYDGDEGLVLIADLPGVSLDSLDLQVQDNKLSLLGRVPHAAPENARLIHKEYDEGDFLRSFILSEEVDHERITAKLNNGVLEVVLPRAAKSPPRRIQVQSE
jgi:HSP20 family protein